MAETQPGGAFASTRLHVVTGKGGTGKTTVAAALAVAKASGCKLFGLYNVVTPGPVFVMAGEAAHNLPRLLKAARRAQGLSQDAALPIQIVPQVFSLYQPGWEYLQVKALAEKALAETGRPLFIWDTLGIYSAPAKENANDEMQVAMNYMRAIPGDHVVIHHTDKKDTDARGAGSIKANLDALFMLVETDGRLVLNNSKQRNMAEAVDVHLVLVPDADLGSVAVRPASSITKEPGDLSPNQRAVLDALWESFATSGATTPQLVTALPHVKERTLYHVLEQLVKHGFARRDGNGTRVYPVNR
jgi:hypothetical protein